jgi:hypothetical protein
MEGWKPSSQHIRLAGTHTVDKITMQLFHLIPPFNRGSRSVSRRVNINDLLSVPRRSHLASSALGKASSANIPTLRSRTSKTCVQRIRLKHPVHHSLSRPLLLCQICVCFTTSFFTHLRTTLLATKQSGCRIYQH